MGDSLRYGTQCIRVLTTVLDVAHPGERNLHADMLAEPKLARRRLQERLQLLGYKCRADLSNMYVDAKVRATVARILEQVCACVCRVRERAANPWRRRRRRWWR